MDKRDIVKKFMEKGVLLSPEELKNIDNGNYKSILKKHLGEEEPEENENLPDEEPFVKNKEAHTIEKEREPPKQNIEQKKEEHLNIEIKHFPKKEKMEVKDFIDYYNMKYVGLRDILMKKLNAVSINKSKDLISTVSVIGMVKEKAQNGFIIEDQTGSIETISKSEPQTGDVIAVTGTVRENKIFEKEITYPDVPLTFKPRSINGTLFLLKDDTNKDVKFDELSESSAAVIILKKTKLKHNFLRSGIQNPSIIKFNKGKNEVLLFAYEPTEPLNQEQATSLLKKRHMSPVRKEIRFDAKIGDPFLLEPIPEIIWLIGGENSEFVKNYKGVTIISTGNKAARIDLETKKVEFI